MKSMFRTPSLLAAALACAATTSALGAGTESWTSAYATIQPNAGNTATVYTISWVALDSSYGGQPFINQSPYGNGGSELDNVNNLFGGGYVFDNTANGGSATTEIQYVSDGVEVNATGSVLFQDPLVTTLGVAAPTTSTPKWDDLGNFSNAGNLTYGSGVQGVTGVFSANPDGTGAAVGTGVGVYHDEDGGAGGTADDLGLLLSGFTNTTFSNTGYIQVVVPNPVSGTVIGTSGTSTPLLAGTYTSNGAIELVVTTDSNYTPKIAVAGDFDSDLDIDNADTAVFIGGFGTGTNYSGGDLDGDGDVDNADTAVFIGNFGATPPSLVLPSFNALSPTNADLLYDPATGNVKLDASEAAGGIITTFQIENGDGTFVPGNYISLTGGTFGGAFETANANVIGDADFTFTGISGVVDLGDILPTGLDEAGLQAYLTEAIYAGQSGSGAQSLDLVVIPEPSSLALLGLGGLMLARRRRA